MNDFERGTKRIGPSQETQMNEMQQAIQHNKDKRSPMTAEPHPQRCLHSHICKWNKDNYQDCIDTDCASHRYTYGNNQQSEQETERILDTLKCIENAALACVWSDAPDCPGAEDGEIICDGCPLFEWIDPEQLRDYIKEKMAELRKQGEP